MLRVFLFLLCLICVPLPTSAQDKLDLSNFSTLPILHEGRVKPIDSFARVMLKTFSSSETINGQDADEWLAESIFDPASAVEKPVFKIFREEQYGLKKNPKNLYSYMDVSMIMEGQRDVIDGILKTPEKEWTEEQQALIKLHDNFVIYTQILRSLTLILPLNIDGLEQNFIESKDKLQDIEEKVKKIVALKGTNLNRYSEEEKQLAALSFQLKVLEEGSKNNVVFRIIPEHWNDLNAAWTTPWNISQQENISARTLEYLSIWKDLADSYRTNNAATFKKESANALAFFENIKLKIEKIYNKLHLLRVAEIFYIFSFALIVLSAFFRNVKIEKSAFGLMVLGLITQACHIAMRVFILERPPVGTLYESILFVSLVSVTGFTYLVWKQKNSTGTLLGSLSGILLLITAQGFTSEDTMSTLVAVLNTNFWLGTHVLCISIGYGLCLITSLMAHYYLVQKVLKPQKERLFDSLMRNIKTMLILSLLFTTVGTILGGIWADQSWGRFWGWDPKENGALLIVLWLIWLLHGRISQHINDKGLIIGSAFLSIIVVLAWFGVNLLNVGLHSYGFITGVATGIAAFCAFEILAIGGLYCLGRQKEKNS